MAQKDIQLRVIEEVSTMMEKLFQPIQEAMVRAAIQMEMVAKNTEKILDRVSNGIKDDIIESIEKEGDSAKECIKDLTTAISTYSVEIRNGFKEINNNLTKKRIDALRIIEFLGMGLIVILILIKDVF